MSAVQFPSITFWQPTAAIETIASAVGSLTSNPTPPPSDQIATFTPIAGTLTATFDNPVVTRNSGPVFTGNVLPGDRLAAFDGTSWHLLGIVATVADNSITLTAGAANSTVATSYAYARGDIRPNQGVYVRVQTLIGSGSNANARRLPWLRRLRSPNSGDPSVYCDPLLVAIQTFSEPNAPTQEADPAETIQVTIRRTTTYAPGTTPGTLFGNTNQFPLFVWYLIDPFGSQDSVLYWNTLFNLAFQDTLEDYEVTVNMMSIYASETSNYGNF